MRRAGGTGGAQGKRQLQGNSQNTPASRNFLFALPTLVWNTVIYMKLLEKNFLRPLKSPLLSFFFSSLQPRCSWEAFLPDPHLVGEIWPF